jgi:hypothetical protein
MPDFSINHYFSAGERRLGVEVPNGRRQFLIPMNQRPFVWKHIHIRSLWRDFLQQINTNYAPNNGTEVWVERSQLDGFPHFMGNFIFVERPTGEDGVDAVDVFDGQQRLTALSMIASCLVDQGQSLLSAFPGDPILMDAWARLRAWVVANPGPNEHRPRLLVDLTFRSLFDAVIVTNRSQTNRTAAVSALGIDFSERKDHENFWKRFCDMQRLVVDTFHPLSDQHRLRFLLAATTTLNQSLLGIVTTVKLEAYGLRIFASLNTLAEPLTAIDNLKNEFFMRVQKSEHPQVSAAWRQVIDSLGYVPPKDFLRRRLIGLGHDCRNDDQGLFMAISEHELAKKSAADLVNLLGVWGSEASTVRKLRDAAGFNTRTQRYLRDIYSTLGASIADIFLLSAHRILMPNSPTDFELASRLIRNYLFRELTIKEVDTALIERRLQSACVEMRVSGLAGACAKLSVQSSDESFLRSFTEKSDSRLKIQFFVLYCLEEHISAAQGLVPHPSSPSQHIEHIVPKKCDRKLPSGTFAWPFWKRRRASYHTSYLNRFGNLLLLEADINKAIGNFSFSEKVSGNRLRKSGVSIRKKGYLDSNLRLAKWLFRTKLNDFTAEDIDRRQRFMAKIAARVWKLKL